MHKVTKMYEAALLPHFLPAIRLAFSHVGLFMWFMLLFTEFTEATRITGGLSKHRQKPYNTYYPNN